MPRCLLELPGELVVYIVAHLALDKHTLCSLARTCRLLQVECEKHIYDTLPLLSTDHLRAIIEAFTSRPERIASVETLRILYRFHRGLGTTADERSAFNRCVAAMTQLRHWHIESPYDNFKWQHGGGEWVTKDMDEFRKAIEAASLHADNMMVKTQQDIGLAKLEHLVIHSHGIESDFWNLRDFHCLFRHPGLRHLHISCLVLPTDIPDLEPYAHSTPLATLVFDECELEPKSLARILRTPKSLKNLTLGENVYNTNRSRSRNPRLSRTPEASLDALLETAHSLETLTHHDPCWRPSLDSYDHRPLVSASSKGGLRTFHALRMVNVNPNSFLHKSFILSHTQAPPNLATLRIHHARPPNSVFFEPPEDTYDLFERLPPCEPYTYLESLKTLEFIQGASLDMPTARSEHICQEASVRQRHLTAYRLFKRGINVRLHLEATWRRSLIPPFLHGEPHPEYLCVYDAKTIGFRRCLKESTASPETPLSDHSSLTKPGDLLETAELTVDDILRLRNEVRRSLDSLKTRMVPADVSLFLDDDNNNLENDIDTHVAGVYMVGEDDSDFDSDDVETEWFDLDEDEMGTEEEFIED